MSAKHIAVFLVGLLCLDFIPTNVNSANVLVVLFAASKSHKNIFDPLMEELAKRGHHVTVISPIKPSKEVPNIRNIVGTDMMDWIIPNPFTQRLNRESSIISIYKMFSALWDPCSHYFEHPEVVDLIQNAHFDLIYTNVAAADCSLGFIHHFKASLIYVSVIAAAGPFASSAAGPQPPSFIPSPMSTRTDRMNFMERVVNFVETVLYHIMLDYFVTPMMEEAYKEKFPNAPGIREIEGNVSLILSNGHFSTNYPRPMMPDVIDVGGMHCRPSKPLPKELDDFLNGSGKDGFIYFSLGSIAQGSSMPENVRKAFLGAFSKLKQRVIWKWETEQMEGLPSNVKLGKWIPQQDVLGHPNIKLFITHGGLLSKQEAVYHGVPLLGMPLFAEQDWNMKASETSGFALTLELEDITEELVLTQINRMLNEPRFMENAKTVSRIFRDQPETPLERAVFWSEYVLRHKGASHMRSPSRDLNFLQYHSIDVVGVLLALFFSVIFLTSKIAKLCLRKIRSRGLSAKALKLKKDK